MESTNLDVNGTPLLNLGEGDVWFQAGLFAGDTNKWSQSLCIEIVLLYGVCAYDYSRDSIPSNTIQYAPWFLLASA